MTLNNERCLEKLTNFSVLMQILPPKSRKTMHIFKIYAMTSAAIFTTIFFWSSIGRFNYIYVDQSMVKILAMLDQFSQTFLCVSCLISSVGWTFSRQENYVEFAEKLTRMAKILDVTWIKRENLLKIFVIFLIFLLSALTYDAYIWLSTLGMSSFQFYALKSLQFFQCSLNAFLMFAFTSSIENLFDEFGARLDNHLCIEKIFYKDFKQNKHQNTRYFIRIHHELCNLVDNFNTIFGFNILFIVFNCIINILFNAGLSAVYALNTSRNIDGIHYGIALIISRLQWITISLVLPVMIAYACDGVEKQSKKIIPIALKYLNNLPSCPKSYEDRTLKEDLGNLCRQAQLRCPVFSAAGFFNINFTMMGFILGSITSYVIVTLQLADEGQSNQRTTSEA